MDQPEHIFTDLEFEQGLELRDAILDDLAKRLERAPGEIQEALAAFDPRARMGSVIK